MAAPPLVYPVYRSINRPLTIWGVDRRLFFLALGLGGVMFNFFGSLLGGLALFLAAYAAARHAARRDPQLLRILLNSARFRARYDAGKFSPYQPPQVTADA